MVKGIISFAERSYLLLGGKVIRPSARQQVGAKFFGGVAQWVEQRTHKPRVTGSNPVTAIFASRKWYINFAKQNLWYKET